MHGLDRASLSRHRPAFGGGHLDEPFRVGRSEHMQSEAMISRKDNSEWAGRALAVASLLCAVGVAAQPHAAPLPSLYDAAFVASATVSNGLLTFNDVSTKPGAVAEEDLPPGLGVTHAEAVTLAGNSIEDVKAMAKSNVINEDASANAFLTFFFGLSARSALLAGTGTPVRFVDNLFADAHYIHNSDCTVTNGCGLVVALASVATQLVQSGSGGPDTVEPISQPSWLKPSVRAPTPAPNLITSP
jgi:hypothetical protein